MSVRLEKTCGCCSEQHDAYIDCDDCGELKLLSNQVEKQKKALDFIAEWGGIDGGHHKQWVLDQLVRILTDDYDKWVAEWQDGEDGPETYLWDEGIAP